MHVDLLNYEHQWRVIVTRQSYKLHTIHQELMEDLINLSISPYSAVRKHAQSALGTALKLYPAVRTLWTRKVRLAVFFTALACFRQYTHWSNKIFH